MGMVFWLTGLSGAGKSTLALACAAKLREQGRAVTILDGDIVRKGLCQDLGYSLEDRRENNRRCAEVAKILACSANQLCLCSFISPTKALRSATKTIIGAAYYREIYVKCQLSICIERDPKGNYARALAGKLPGYTGIDAPYEEPEDPDCIVDTGVLSLEESCKRTLAFMCAVYPFCPACP